LIKKNCVTLYTSCDLTKPDSTNSILHENTDRKGPRTGAREAEKYRREESNNTSSNVQNFAWLRGRPKNEKETKLQKSLGLHAEQLERLLNAAGHLISCLATTMRLHRLPILNPGLSYKLNNIQRLR
jgi:hypothetical protein